MRIIPFRSGHTLGALDNSLGPLSCCITTLFGAQGSLDPPWCPPDPYVILSHSQLSWVIISKLVKSTPNVFFFSDFVYDQYLLDQKRVLCTPKKWLHKFLGWWKCRVWCMTLSLWFLLSAHISHLRLNLEIYSCEHIFIEANVTMILLSRQFENSLKNAVQYRKAQ